METDPQSTHKWWLERMIGETTTEQEYATPMPGLQDVPLSELVVANLDDDKLWTLIKQAIIPLKPAKSVDNIPNKAARLLKNMQDKLNSDDAFFVLVNDEQIALYEDNWVLSIINPRELALPEDRLRANMEISYQTGDDVGGSSSRAALLATTGMISI